MQQTRKMDRIIQHLKNSSHLLITTHADMDGDAVGSLIAAGLAMAMQTEDVTLYSDTTVPAVYRFLPSASCIVHSLNDIKVFDTVMVLDCGDMDRIGRLVPQIKQIPVIINIDHHVTNTGFGDYQLIDTTASATAEIVYRLIKAMGTPIDKAIATSIYTGILTDTGSFRFSNTTKEAFAICEEMVQLGVDPYDVAQHVYGAYSIGRIRLLLLALNSIEISENGKVSLMALTQTMLDETGTTSEDIDGMINYARSIKNVKVAILIQEKPNGTSGNNQPHEFHVSLRSNGTVDVSSIAASFGGGGHPGAAGFSIKSELSDLKTEIFKLAERL